MFVPSFNARRKASGVPNNKNFGINLISCLIYFHHFIQAQIKNREAKIPITVLWPALVRSRGATYRSILECNSQGVLLSNTDDHLDRYELIFV